MSYFDNREKVFVIDNGRDFFVQGAVGHRYIAATDEEVSVEPSRGVKYNGRKRTWPGALLLGAMLVASALGIYICGRNHYADAQARVKKYNDFKYHRKSIRGGDLDGDGIDDLIDSNGMIGNPDKYPLTECELPNYQSKNGKIVAVSSNGTEVPISIKGVNWFGMETSQAIPFGLWDNDTAGTTAYHVAAFLSTNKFNAVRLPLMVNHILNNTEPNKDMINSYTNQAVSVKDYMSLLKSIVKVLQFRRISVLISLHTLTSEDSGGLWYNEDISEKDFLKAVDLLTSNLCEDEYWNVVGLDVKNEPHKATWGTGKATDFRVGAKTIIEQMLAGCPKWLGFVEGLNYRTHDVVIDGAKFTYNDWFGGGLQDAKSDPIELNTEHKIVWAPHYYTSSVFVQPYFYGGGKLVPSTRILDGFVELSDTALKNRVAGTMEDMFGYLVDETPQYAVVLGEFGGIYATDEHPKKTIQRTVDYNIEVMLERGYAGGFMWSLNPESKYQYVSGDKGSPLPTFEEGLVQLDWLVANTVYLNAIKPLDNLPDLRKFPCFPAPKA